MSLLHPDRWQELSPQFEAAAHLAAAADAARSTDARLTAQIELVMRSLHPVVLDPAGRAEYEQHRHASQGGESGQG